MDQKNESILKYEISRRSFIKRSAAGVAMAAVGATMSGGVMTALALNAVGAAPEVDERMAHGVCRIGACTGCSLDVLVRDGNIVRTKARALPGKGDLTRICGRGAVWPHQIVDDKRIKYPMKRVGERGSGQWEQITWDEAISIICDKIKAHQSQYGKSSVASYANSAYSRLENVAEFCDVDICVDHAYEQSYFYNIAYYIQTPMNHDEEIIRNLKTYVAWGSNRVEAWPQRWKYIADAIEHNGAKMVVIDPVYNTQASKADMFISIKPGTDGALAMALIKYLDEQKMTADAYLQERSVAPFLVKEDGRYLRKSDLQKLDAGVADDYVVWDRKTNAYGFASEVKDPEIRKGTFEITGQKVMTAYDKLLERVAPFTLERASEICSVPTDTIIEFAELLGNNSPAEIITGFAVDHNTYGFGSLAAINALRMVAGMITWPVVNPSLGSKAGFTAAEKDHPVMSGKISTFMFKDLLETGKYELPGVTIEQQLKTWLIFGGNPVSMQPDRQNTLESMKLIDFIAVANVEWCDSTMYADIVLPVCSTMETPDVLISTSCVMYAEQVVAPLFESKSDFEIAKLLAQGLGFGKYYDFDIEETLHRAVDNSPSLKDMGITFNRLKEEKTIRLNTPPTVHKYSTNTGRLQFYIETMTPFLNFGQTFDMETMCLPYWQPPYEAWPGTAGGYEKNPLADKYPLIYLTGPRRFRVHTSWGNVRVLRELEGNEPTIRMNPEDAAQRGIQEGDHVRVFNDRGHAVVKAVFHTGIRSGVVDIDRGWQQHQFIEGHYQDLTSKAIVDWGCPNYAFYDALCEVEKV